MWQTAKFVRGLPVLFFPSRSDSFGAIGSRLGPAVVLAGLMAFGACATDRSPAPAVTRLPAGMCTSEKPLGSHRPTRVCRSNAQIEADRKQAQETLNQVRKTPGGAAATQ